MRISLLTCDPGAELYSAFGHTALRVQDGLGGDYVFNYGTFEFSPDFNIKFIRGKLLYSLSVEDYEGFLATYRYESRSVREQEVLLSCEKKQELFQALRENSSEENRYYKYDFLFDNCTTRAGDMVVNHAGAPVVFGNILPAKTPSFRDLIHSYLDAGHQYWSKLGIDILLGAKLDRKVSNQEAMFLPNYLEKGFDRARFNGQPLVHPSQTILALPSPLAEDSFFKPLLVFSFLALAVVLLSLMKLRWASAALKVFDFLFFFILGLAGILLLFMWFGTDHKVCRNNYNLAWALPTNLVMAFFVQSRKQWPKIYFRLLGWFTILLLIAWYFLPQQMNDALQPIVFLIIFRCWALTKTGSNESV